MSNGSAVKENLRELHQNRNDKQLRASFAAREINNVNENYFGAYGSFGIHREMISDKVLRFSKTCTFRNLYVMLNCIEELGSLNVVLNYIENLFVW